ncbi:hypothetical protein T10_2521 [Trichinella papuae]|uniref:Uncharacterized protein n=1 Tax=Trichinella papuae TaxID=268474 RepID=A0A0V1N4S8_9BILA|nr:hypothetical protein T10_2521 [Trichinella papuae]
MDEVGRVQGTPESALGRAGSVVLRMCGSLGNRRADLDDWRLYRETDALQVELELDRRGRTKEHGR